MFQRYEFVLKTTVLAVLLGTARTSYAANTFTVSTKSSLVPHAAVSAVSSSGDPSAPATNAALKVVVAVRAGDNQTFSEVVVDTGSAILWVGAQDRYEPGPNTQVINKTFSVGYGSGGVNGTAYEDRVTIGAATVNSQIIGSAQWWYGFTLQKPFDGIFGLGPAGSNSGQVLGDGTTPTFVEGLVSEGTIDEALFGIYVGPLNEGGESAGEITFGGVDESRISGNISWIDQNTPVDFHWEFNTSSFTWGNITLDGPIYSRTDTGVLPIAIPSDQFFDMLEQVPGATIDSDSALTGSLIFPGNMSTDAMAPLEIALGNLAINITAEQYIIPTSLYAPLNITDDGNIHTWIAPAGPTAFDFGQKFMEHVYSAYDMKNHLVGFAQLA